MRRTEPANNEIKNRLYRESNAGNKAQNSGDTFKDAMVASMPGQVTGVLYSIGETFGEAISFGSISYKAYGGTWKLPVNLGVLENTFKQLGVLGLALSIRSNMDYGVGTGLAISGIDILGFAATAVFASGGGWIGVGIGLGIGVATEYIKWEYMH